MESQESTSPPRRLASSAARRVFPEAVGPAIQMMWSILCPLKLLFQLGLGEGDAHRPAVGAVFDIVAAENLLTRAFRSWLLGVVARLDGGLAGDGVQQVVPQTFGIQALAAVSRSSARADRLPSASSKLMSEGICRRQTSPSPKSATS